jgi:Aerotolerance regulator N-terminal/von Willebrand factor type A domain
VGFLTPGNLLWASSIAVLVAIYLRSRSRPTLEVSSLMLFDDAPAPVASVRHVRLDLLFWLELCALSAMVLAIGGLYVMLPARQGHGRAHALVFDVAAGMSASDHGVSRLDRARQAALEMIDSAAPDEEFSVISYALDVRVDAPMTARRAALTLAIKSLHALAVPARASVLAAAIMRAHGAATVDLFTDRPPAREVLAQAGAQVRVHQISGNDNNVALISLDPGAVGSTRGNVVLRNFSVRPQLSELAIELGSTSVFHQTLMLAPRERIVLPFGPLRAGGVLDARILTPDAIAADNQRWAFASTAAAMPVLVLSPDRGARDDLARVLLAVNQNFQVRTADPADFRSAAGAATYELAVMHDCYLPRVPARSTLLVYPPVNPPRLEGVPGLSVERSLSAATMSGPRDDAVKLGATRVIEVPEWMNVLATASGRGTNSRFPVSAIGKIPDGRIGVLAFDLRGHFLMNPDNLDALVATIDLVKQLTAPGDVQIVSTGAYVSVPAAAPARVTRPDGTTVTLAPDKWGRVHLRPLLEGDYTVESRGTRVHVYANYFDAAESDLAVARTAPAPVETAPTHQAAAAPRPLKVHPLTFAMVVLALIALLAESVILARRTARWRVSNV